MSKVSRTPKASHKWKPSKPQTATSTSTRRAISLTNSTMPRVQLTNCTSSCLTSSNMKGRNRLSYRASQLSHLLKVRWSLSNRNCLYLVSHRLLKDRSSHTNDKMKTRWRQGVAGYLVTRNHANRIDLIIAESS